VAALATPSAPVCAKPTLTSYQQDNIPQIWPLQVDLLLAAMRCGLTNVGNLQVGDFHRTWLNLNLPFEVAYGIGHALHHWARDMGQRGSHYQYADAWYDEMLANRRLRAQMVQRLLLGLKATPEGEGNMLDNSLLLWTSETSYGGAHSGTDLPVMLAGKAAGRIRTGRYLNYNTKAATNPNTLESSTQASVHNLHTSILNVFGYPDTHFGNEMMYVKGPLSGWS
jgi:hypothetical protein